MLAVIYGRVSRDETKQNIQNQLLPLRKFAQCLDFTVIKEYTDHASGRNSNRPQFQQMLNDAKKREFDIILIWALDRFSREGILNTLSYLIGIKTA